MLLTMCSTKGSPGGTSAALTLAAAWPRPVVLAELDPSGSDIALRCRAIGGGFLTPRPSVLDLADLRTGSPDAVLGKVTQQLACGVPVIQGIATPSQAGSLDTLWPMIADAARGAGIDVIADVGRLSGAPRAVVEEATHLVLVGTAGLEQQAHVREALRQLAHTQRPVLAQPVVVGYARHAGDDCSDLDMVLANARVPARKAMSLAWDPATLDRIQAGAPLEGKLRKKPLGKSAVRIAEQLAQDVVTSEGWSR